MTDIKTKQEIESTFSILVKLINFGGQTKWKID